MKNLIYLFSISIFTLLLSCKPTIDQPNGETLAKTHCASCHQYPSPNLLDKKSWEKHILPRMGYMLGVLPIDSTGGGFIEPFAETKAFSNPNLFRKNGSLSIAEWEAIKEFYVKNAPEQLSSKNIEIEIKKTSLFKPQFPNYFLSPPSTTLIAEKENGFFIGDAHTRKLYSFNDEINIKAVANIGEAPVWINEINTGYLATNMGAFSPTDAPLGKVVFLPKKKSQDPFILIDSLKRPVHTEMADLNNDGRFDLIISEYAKWTGCLAWWKNDGKGNFKKHILRNMPGAIKAYARDMNDDGLLDIIALFGQGDEGVFICYNNGDESFTEKRILRFPPSYGSSYFNLFDYDKDGFLDIIYTNGDNADFPPINKPYHGIRIFKNDSKNNFEEIFFQPMHGAYSAIPADFDMDGDIDIAAISFFNDFKNKKEPSFIFLKNNGELNMERSTIPYADKGRWIVMESMDINKDGDLDLILGSLAFEVVPKMGLVEKWIKDGIPFMVLENQTVE